MECNIRQLTAQARAVQVSQEGVTCLLEMSGAQKGKN